MPLLRSLRFLLFEKAWPFFALLFFGSLFWAHSRDPFRRTEFTVKTNSGTKIHGITVLPARFRTGPVMVYAHGSGGTWLTDGNVLRQFAELGMAAVGLDYDQTNSDAFEGEFSTVLDYVHSQPWADTNRIAWVGFSLGAQNTLHYLLKHSQDHPQCYVRLAGGWLEELTNSAFSVQHLAFPTLLIHAQNDEIFPMEDVRRSAKYFRTHGSPVTLRIIADHGHAFGTDQAVVFRLMAEYCKAQLTPKHPLPEFPQLHAYSFLLCVAPALAWAVLWLYFCQKSKPSPPVNSAGNFEIALPVAAILLAILATADSALHLIPPRMQITPQTLTIARRFLLAPSWPRDFETLAGLPIWRGQKLHTLLTHVELAHYTVYELVNWKVDDAVYVQYVLSPVITGADYELDWRRRLWENFWPRVRHENTTSNAAEIVVRFLRQRVTVAPSYPAQAGVESMWNGHIVNLADFEILYVAALRSVGVPARLNSSRQAEFWTGQTWQSAPRPLAVTWVE